MIVAAKIIEAYPKAAPIVDGIIALGVDLGVHPYFIANVIQVESNYNPQARNPKRGATGLIQFTNTVAEKLGTNTDKLRSMSIQEQFQYVIKYLSMYKGRIRSQADVYMAVFQPARIGQPLSTPLSAKAQAKNPTIRTLQDYVDKANARVRLPTGGALPPVTAPTPVAPPAVNTEAEKEAKRKKARAKERRRKRKVLLIAIGVGLTLTTLVGTFAYFVNKPLLAKRKPQSYP